MTVLLLIAVLQQFNHRTNQLINYIIHDSNQIGLILDRRQQC